MITQKIENERAYFDLVLEGSALLQIFLRDHAPYFQDSLCIGLHLLKGDVQVVGRSEPAEEHTEERLTFE